VGIESEEKVAVPGGHFEVFFPSKDDPKGVIDVPGEFITSRRRNQAQQIKIVREFYFQPPFFHGLNCGVPADLTGYQDFKKFDNIALNLFICTVF
jgi:hypothetical protein